MKINKRYLLLRMLISPIKLIFTIFWFALFSFLKTYQWVIYGSEEIIFGNDKDSIKDLIKVVNDLKDKYKKNRLRFSHKR